jgi:transcriptional regulator with XRE-family HTH domain
MNRIKEVLKDKGISQTWLADKMGKSYNTINEYARNKRQPSIEVLFKIAEILNMEAKELIEKRDLKENI